MRKSVGLGSALFAGLMIFLGLSSAAGAERHLFGWVVEPLTGTIEADRPGFSTSPQTVPAGRLQIEGGYQFTADRGADSHAMPLLLIRAGLSKQIELRVQWDGLAWTENKGRYKPEANDMSLGAKVSVAEQEGLVPALGLLGSLSLPTGSGSLTSNRVDPTGGLLWSYELSAGPGLFGTVTMSSVTGDKGRFFEATNAMGISLPVTDRLGSFVEYYGIYGKGIGPAHTLDGGLTFVLTDNLQLDINGGFGLNRRADDYFLGSGFAFRF